MRLSVVALLLVLVSAQTWPAEVEKPPLPTGGDGNEYTAKPIEEGYAAEILLPAKVSGPVGLVVLDPELKSAAVVETLDDPGGKPRKAIVKLTKKELSAGGHPLVLVLGSGEQALEYPIEISIPAVELNHVPSKILLTQTRVPLLGTYCWSGDQCEVKIPLSPKDGEAWLTSLRGQVAEPFLKDSNVTTGALELTVKPDSFGVGDPPAVPQLSVTANREFVTGESEGKLRVLADQFEAPVSIPVTVQAKLTSLVLIPVILVGLLMGILIRDVLKKRILRRKRQIEAEKLRVKISEYLESHEDSNLQKKIKAILSAIVEAQGGREPIPEEKIKGWKDGFQEELKNYGTRKTEFIKDVEGLHGIVTTKYVLPEAFGNPLEKATKILQELLTVPKNDVEKGKTTLAETEGALQDGCGLAAEVWHGNWLTFDSAIEELKPLLLSNDKAQAEAGQNSANELEKSVTQFTGAPSKTREMLKSALNAVHWNRGHIEKRAPQLAGVFLDFQEEVEGELKLKQRDKSEAWVAWKKEAETAAELLKERDWTKAAEALRELRGDLKTMIRMSTEGLDDEAKGEVLGFLDSDSYLLAIRKLKLPPDADELAGGPADEAAVRGLPFGGALQGVVADVIEAGGGPPQRKGEDPPSLPELESDLERMEWGRRIVVGVLLCFLAWVVLSQTFTGAKLDYLIAFAWAFMTDLTTENLVAFLSPAAQKVKIPGS